MVKQISEVKGKYDIDTEYGLIIENRICPHCSNNGTFQIEIKSGRFNDIPENWDEIKKQKVKETLSLYSGDDWDVNVKLPHHTETHYLCIKCSEVNIHVGELIEATFSAYSTRESLYQW